MIKIKSLSKHFSDKTALDDISISINEGEFIAITGPSGSGKSTLLNIISGLDTPTSGTLSKHYPAEIGFVFQEFHLEPKLTVLDNILLPTFFNKQKDSKEKALQLIKSVGLTSRKLSKAQGLSGGEKQRTAIARALICNPKIIIADEPTGNLDDKTSETIITLLKKLHKEHGKTMIIATHDQQIAKMADRIITIKDGKLC